MLLALLLALQDRPVFPGGEEDGTRTIATTPNCDKAGDEIVVCGTADPEQYRLRKVAPRYVEPLVRAAVQVGPGEVAVEGEQRNFPGATAPAATVRFRMPLGKKPK
ncbi:hypothetical protein RZN05_18910 [Sphingomonas sp. HF-S4]|uniref:Uncharacterized protein n=1 Tax=Sphingomonas agrestis TaxID=3080540 RepID=A0ABU3YCQ6_9SPHN|nr:hypothetical protein [Sphingomonas sp. HF-S4]MDV3459077.1 hypothetical protein [Sphingomonas sp. HF-S4]